MEQPKRPPGRPRTYQDEPLIQRSIRLRPTDWAKIDEYGMDWLRRLIAKAKPPTNR